jgi:hypothetical protein
MRKLRVDTVLGSGGIEEWKGHWLLGIGSRSLLLYPNGDRALLTTSGTADAGNWAWTC